VKVYGLDCAEEVAALRSEVGPIAGGEDLLSFNIVSGIMTVDGSVPAVTILDAVARTGLRAEVLPDDARPGGPHLHDDRRERALLTALSGAFTIAGFVAHAALRGAAAAVGGGGPGVTHAVPVAAAILYGLGVVCGVRFVIRKAWLAAVDRRADMNLLMTVAVIGAMVLGEWFEASTVAFLFSLSLALEAWSVGRARRAVAALLKLSPPEARVKLPTGEATRPVEAVPVGSLFVVHPGERVPLDGVVAVGTSGVNQAPITGESNPVLKEPGSEVFAGTINGDGALEVRSTRPASDTTLAKIVRLIQDAQSQRSNTERWVDRFARYYTPTVMVLAVAFFVIPPLLSMGSWASWLYRSLVLLVIACPCALVISTPVSIVAALTSAARMGVLIKGGVFLEIPARLRAIAFDKTGTVTEGRLGVTSVVPLNGHSEREVLERAAALESRSSHPLAKAIMVHAMERGVAVRPAAEVAVLPGKGASGLIDGRAFWVGSHRYLEERNQEEPHVHAELERLSIDGHSVVVVGNAAHVCGFVALTDRHRNGVEEVMAALRGLGVERLVLLTGDNHGAGRSVGDTVGFDEVRSELLPEDKVSAVRELVQRHGVVAMVGDGVNDAPAMAAASMGVAMGVAGSDVAIETADVALMTDDLSKLPWLIAHSRRTMAIIRANIGFSLLVKLVYVILAFTGSATLWAAIAADMGASLIVVLNGLRLLGGQRMRD